MTPSALFAETGSTHTHAEDVQVVSRMDGARLLGPTAPQERLLLHCLAWRAGRRPRRAPHVSASSSQRAARPGQPPPAVYGAGVAPGTYGSAGTYVRGGRGGRSRRVTTDAELAAAAAGG